MNPPTPSNPMPGLPPDPHRNRDPGTNPSQSRHPTNHHRPGSRHALPRDHRIPTTKQQRYYFNLDPLREPLARPEALGENIVIGGSTKGQHAGIDATTRRRGTTVSGKYTTNAPFLGQPPGAAMRPTGMRHSTRHPDGKNPAMSGPFPPDRYARRTSPPTRSTFRCAASPPAAHPRGQCSTPSAAPPPPA
jgi:hypothetical protein